MTQLAQQFAQIEQHLENDNAVQEALVDELDYAVRTVGEVEDGWLDHTTGLYQALAVDELERSHTNTVQRDGTVANILSSMIRQAPELCANAENWEMCIDTLLAIDNVKDDQTGSRKALLEQKKKGAEERKKITKKLKEGCKSMFPYHRRDPDSDDHSPGPREAPSLAPLDACSAKYGPQNNRGFGDTQQSNPVNTTTANHFEEGWYLPLWEPPLLDLTPPPVHIPEPVPYVGAEIVPVPRMPLLVGGP